MARAEAGKAMAEVEWAMAVMAMAMVMARVALQVYLQRVGPSAEPEWERGLLEPHLLGRGGTVRATPRA